MQSRPELQWRRKAETQKIKQENTNKAETQKPEAKHLKTQKHQMSCKGSLPLDRSKLGGYRSQYTEKVLTLSKKGFNYIATSANVCNLHIFSCFNYKMMMKLEGQEPVLNIKDSYSFVKPSSSTNKNPFEISRGGYPLEKPGQTPPTPLSKHGTSRQITRQTFVLKNKIRNNFDRNEVLFLVENFFSFT